MFTLNFKDGTSKKFDILDELDRKTLNTIGQDHPIKKEITAIWLMTQNHSITLPIPQRFRRVLFFGEIIYEKKTDIVKGEKLTIQADNIKIIVTTYFRKEGTMHSVAIQNVGKQMFNPNGGF